MLFGPSGKGRKRQKKADFGRFPGWAARRPLNPHLLHPHLRHSNFQIEGQTLKNLRWPDSRESFQELKPFKFANRASGGLKIANCSFEAIRANCQRIMRIGIFLRIDSCESPRFALRIRGPSIRGRKTAQT